MKKYFFGLLAVVFAVGAVAFTNPSNVSKEGDLTNYYFKFVGNLNDEEGDVTKWEEITNPIDYANLTCGAANYGCKLIATQTQVISSVVRPAAIYLVSGTKNPTTGTHVSAVSNKQN